MSFTNMTADFEGISFCETPLYPPPGLTPAPICEMDAPNGDSSEQELLLAYQEFVIARQECEKLEQRGAHVWEPSDLSIFCPVSSMPLQPLYTRGNVDDNVVSSLRSFAAPLKPPGVFMKSSSTHSLASTAASVTKELEESSSPAGAAEATWNLAEDAQKVENDCHKEVNRELQVEHDAASRHLRISWPVDAKKLASKDQQIVSPIFEILPGCTFRLMLKPTQVGAKKGQASFKKAKGWGSADLKLVGCDGVAPTLCFGVSVGSDYRGHLQHDFEDNAVNSNPKFDFTSAVEGSTFLVTLEVASNQEEHASSG
jgi:hypothetical protein